MKTKKNGIFYISLAAAVVMALILAACDNPSSSAGGNETTGNTVGISIDLGGKAGLGLAGGTIYLDKEPSRLELTVKGTGWDSLDWNLDGKNVAAWKNQAAVTMNAADYAEARHTLALTGLRGGARYSAGVTVTVTRERPGVIWTQTDNDSSLTTFDLAAWQGESGPTETWALSVIEQPVVYFAVRKPLNATITVQGVPPGVEVIKAALGETLDGSVADEFLDLFTVKPGKDALFGEGECSFTLAVAEPGKQPKTVKVSAAVRPNLTGIAVFRRVVDGSLARITAANAADHANTLYAAHKNGTVPGWGIDFGNVQNLSTALKWLDNYALSGTDTDHMAEYLVRVEADEKMPKTLLTCRLNIIDGILADYIRIRIRGYGGERTISHDSMNTHTGSVQKGASNNMSAGDGFLNIGPNSGGGYVLNHLAVHLENNITIDAGSGAGIPYANTDPRINSMVEVRWGNTLVMEAGSKLTNYTASWGFPEYTAVYLPGGAFELRGGEISNIQAGVDHVIYWSDSAGGTFINDGGIFINNRADAVGIGYSSHYPVTDPMFAP